MKFTILFLLVFSCILFHSSFAAVDNNQNKIDYDSFKKFRDVGYSYHTYTDYLKKTKFDKRFMVNIVEQTPGYGASRGGNIIVIINQNLYNPTTMDDIQTYKNDLLAEGYSVSIVTSTNVSNPVALRNFLYQEWTTNNIDGAFLIGTLPVAWYELPLTNNSGDTTGWDEFPCDLYFMDLDGTWLDNYNQNGVWDDHAGALAPDIWIGRLYTSTMTFHGVNETQLVETYLKKVHRYREGILRLKNQGFSYVMADWAIFHIENEVFKLYNDVTFVNDGIDGGNVTVNDYRHRIRAATNNKYEWMFLAAHSSPTDHYFKDGLFNSSEIDFLDVQVLFYLNFNCSAARFTENNCLCNWYVMQGPYGLLSIGSTKSGSMLDQDDYYEPLSQGYTFGEAFKYWGIRHFERRDWHYGIICVGDPTLKISRFMANPGPRFCYALTPERNAFLDSTTVVFKWTTADSADNYVVEVTGSGNPVWTSNAISDTLIQIPGGFLQHAKSYNWTVKAYAGSECIDFTQERMFTVLDTTSGCISQFVNPDFEQGSYGWTFGDLNPEAQFIDSTQAHSGNASLRHCLYNFYYAYTHQEMTVPNGVYTLHAWVKTSGDQYTSVIELRQTGEDVNIQLPQQPTSEWTKVNKIFSVNTGKIKIGIYSNAPANSWLNIDDMSILNGADLTIPVTLLAPVNGGIFITKNILLDWDDIIGSDGYRLFLFYGGMCILDEDNLSQSQFQIPDSLLSYGETYQWYVQWKKDSSYSEISEYRSFSLMAPGQQDCYLSELVPAYASQDWGTLQFDKSCDGNILTIAGQQFQKGLGTHANSIIRYNLSGAYRWFTATIGHDDEANGGDGLTFEVKLDNSTVYGPSPIVMWGTSPQYIEINVINGCELELLVHDGGVGNIDYDHADWANAKIWIGPVNIAENSGPLLLPQKTGLIGNYPNPFNPGTVIAFQLHKAADVKIVIYNVIGQKVKTLLDAPYKAGSYKIEWNGTNDTGTNVGSGIYLYKMTAGDVTRVRKMILMR